MSSHSDPLYFFGTTATGKYCRDKDWSVHALGNPESWPDELKISLSIVFGSQNPMCLYWGKELFFFYNEAVIPIVGYSKHPSALGAKGESVWPEIWDVLSPQFSQVTSTGIPTLNEDQHLNLMGNDGELREAYITYGYSPISLLNGQVGGVFVTVTETTKRILAEIKAKKQIIEQEMIEAELRRSQKEFQDFLSQVSVGIALLSGDQHRYTFMNQTFSMLCFGGRPESDFLGRTVREALPEASGQGWYEILDSVYATGVPYTGKKVRASLVQKDGLEREFFTNFTFQPKFDANEKINGVVAIVYEVTDQVNEEKEIKDIAEKLGEAIVSRDNFLSIASHELNTPITSLKLQLQMNQRVINSKGINGYTEVSLKKFIDNSKKQVDRLARLVNDMMDSSKMSSGKLSIETKVENLSDLVLHTLGLFGDQLEASKNMLKISVEPNIVLKIDAFRIEQVIVNFLTNTIKYAPGVDVEVTVTKSASTVKVSVKDHGPGIAQDDLHRIFGRFERASSTYISGFGLGLFISKKIIEEHGGKISVESKLREGSTFSFELPIS